MCASATPHSSVVGKSFGTDRMAKEDLFIRLPKHTGRGAKRRALGPGNDCDRRLPPSYFFNRCNPTETKLSAASQPSLREVSKSGD